MDDEVERRSRVPALVGAVLLLAGVVAILVPDRVYPDPVATVYPVKWVAQRQDPRAEAVIEAAQLNSRASLFAAELAAATTRRQGLRAGVLAVGVGLLTALGLYVRWQTHKATEQRNRDDAENVLEERRDSRFATAIEHLAHEKESVRIGGIYSLEGLARDDEGRRQTIVQVLLAHTAPWKSELVAQLTTGKASSRAHFDAPREVRTAYGAALRSAPHDAEPLEAPYAVAYGANLANVELSGANLRQANLVDSQLSGAELSGAWLEGADLSGAVAFGVSLAGAHLEGAVLHDTQLSQSSLVAADLREAQLTQAVLSDCDLSAADLRGAHLDGATLRGSTLTGADLTGADLTQVDLANHGGADRMWSHPEAIEDLTLEPAVVKSLKGTAGRGTHPSHAQWWPTVDADPS